MATPEQIAAVRALIPDNTAPYMFTNEELTVYIDANDGDAYLAAAQAIETLATKMILSGAASEVRTDDLTIKDTTVDMLLARARDLRGIAAGALSDEFQVVYPFGHDAIPEATPAPWGGPWRWGRVTW